MREFLLFLLQCIQRLCHHKTILILCCMTTTVKLQPLCVSPSPLAYTTLLPRSSPSTPSLSPLWKGKGYFWSKPNLMKNMWNQQRSQASMSERKTEFISQWPEKQRFSKTTSVTFTTIIDITKNMLLRIFIYSTCERNHLKSISTSIWNRIS